MVMSSLPLCLCFCKKRRKHVAVELFRLRHFTELFEDLFLTKSFDILLILIKYGMQEGLSTKWEYTNYFSFHVDEREILCGTKFATLLTLIHSKCMNLEMYIR